MSTGPITCDNIPIGCLSSQLTNEKVTYKLTNTFENPTYFISYGIRKDGRRMSSGTHLYSNRLPCLPYVLLLLMCKTPGFGGPTLTEECLTTGFLLSSIEKTSFENNLLSIGSITTSLHKVRVCVLYISHSSYFLSRN